MPTTHCDDQWPEREVRLFEIICRQGLATVDAIHRITGWRRGRIRFHLERLVQGGLLTRRGEDQERYAAVESAAKVEALLAAIDAEKRQRRRCWRPEKGSEWRHRTVSTSTRAEGSSLGAGT